MLIQRQRIVGREITRFHLGCNPRTKTSTPWHISVWVVALDRTSVFRQLWSIDQIQRHPTTHRLFIQIMTEIDWIHLYLKLFIQMSRINSRLFGEIIAIQINQLVVGYHMRFKQLWRILLLKWINRSMFHQSAVSSINKPVLLLLCHLLAIGEFSLHV